MTAPEGTPTPTLPDLCRAAATAIEMLCATLRDCAREVENRGGQRVARAHLERDADIAARAVDLLFYVTPTMGREAERELSDIAEGCRKHYVRPTWALRLMQLAAGASGPRDTVPVEALMSPWGDGCPGRVPEGPYKGCVCTLKGKHAQCEAWETRGGEMFLLSSWVPQAPEEHAGEGGT